MKVLRTKELCDSNVTKIKEKGASISFITELKFDGSSDNALDKLLLQILGAFAELERKIIRSR